MPSIADQFDRKDILDRLGGFGVEGPITPLPQIGTRRIPTISGLSLSQTRGTSGNNIFRLRWFNPQIPNYYKLDGLQISYKTPGSPYWFFVLGSPRSPVEITLSGVSGTPVTFVVQTRLANGQVSPIDVSPRISAQFI